jgi:hypothetical protein
MSTNHVRFSCGHIRTRVARAQGPSPVDFLRRKIAKPETGQRRKSTSKPNTAALKTAALHESQKLTPQARKPADKNRRKKEKQRHDQTLARDTFDSAAGEISVQETAALHESPKPKWAGLKPAPTNLNFSQCPRDQENAGGKVTLRYTRAASEQTGGAR